MRKPALLYGAYPVIHVFYQRYEIAFIGDHCLTQRGICGGEYLNCKYPGILRVSNSDGSYRDAAGHLDDGEERIEPLQMPRRYRYANDRQGCYRRDHSRQVSGSSGARYDDPYSAFVCRFGILDHRLGGTVRREHTHLVGNVEFLQQDGRLTQGGKI